MEVSVGGSISWFLEKFLNYYAWWGTWDQIFTQESPLQQCRVVNTLTQLNSADRLSAEAELTVRPVNSWPHGDLNMTLAAVLLRCQPCVFLRVSVCVWYLSPRREKRHYGDRTPQRCMLGTCGLAELCVASKNTQTCRGSLQLSEGISCLLRKKIWLMFDYWYITNQKMVISVIYLNCLSRLVYFTLFIFTKSHSYQTEQII